MINKETVRMCRGFLPGPPYEPILGPLTRLPVAWLLLQPSRAAARHQQPGAELAVPVQINLTLPEYLVPGDAFDRGMRVEWRPADRFRMYFGRRQFGTRSGARHYCCRLTPAVACLLDAGVAPARSAQTACCCCESNADMITCWSTVLISGIAAAQAACTTRARCARCCGSRPGRTCRRRSAPSTTPGTASR